MDDSIQLDYKTDEFPLIQFENGTNSIGLYIELISRFRFSLAEGLSMEIKVESMDYELDSGQPSLDSTNYSPHVRLLRLTDLEILIIQEEIKRSRSQDIKDEPIDPEEVTQSHQIKEELIDPEERVHEENCSNYSPSSSTSSSSEEEKESDSGDSDPDPDQSKPRRAKRQFSCSVCDEKFGSRELLLAHRAAHLSIQLKSGWIKSKGNLECPLCLDNYPTFEEFKGHLFETHVPALKVNQKSHLIKCPKCEDLTFANGKELMEHLFEIHLAGHKDSPLLLCCEGDFEASLPSQVENHIQKLHHLSKYICTLCGVWVADIKNHMMMHNGKKPFSCPDCGKSFRLNNRLNRHRPVHSKFVSQNTFIKVNEFLTCRICSSTDNDFDSFNDFTEHVFKTHVPSEIDSVKCSVCEDEQEFSGVLFLDHLFEKHRPSKRQLMCPQCPFVSSTPTVMFRHLNIKHQLGRKMCPICGAAVRDVYTHKISVHGGKDWKFPCEQCPAKFPSAVNLKRHMRTHSGERPFNCDSCTYACSRADNLREHKRQAHGVFTYNCASCGKGFARKKDMVRHALQHKKEQNLEVSDEL